MVLVAAVVEGADGRVVTLYDVNGHMLATKQDNDVLLRFEVPASGTYVIKVGHYPAKKIVVVRWSLRGRSTRKQIG